MYTRTEDKLVTCFTPLHILIFFDAACGLDVEDLMLCYITSYDSAELIT